MRTFEPLKNVGNAKNTVFVTVKRNYLLGFKIDLFGSDVENTTFNFDIDNETGMIHKYNELVERYNLSIDDTYNPSEFDLIKRFVDGQKEVRPTYNMENVEIVESRIAGNIKTYLVYADTERFGKHEIMFQAPTKEDCKKWLSKNGVEIKEKTAWDLLEDEIAKPNGRIQIGNTMYRNLRKENGIVYGYSRTDGLTKLNSAFESAVIIGENKARTTTFAYSYQQIKTIKFGNACTW